MLNVNKIIPLMLLFFFICGTFVTAFNPVSASESVENSWNTKTPMDINNVSFFNDLDTAVVNGKIYAMGGYRYNEGGGINGCYDPATDKWTILKTHPNPNEAVALVAFQDKIYCMNSIIPSEIEIYDIATDKWSTTSAILETTLYISKAYTMEEKIFILTSPLLLLQNPYTDQWYNRCIIHLYVFDPVTERCIELAGIPFPMYHQDYVSVLVDDKIMVFGSFFTGTTLTVENKEREYKIFVYNLKTDEWSEIKSDVPDGIGFSLAGATTGRYAPQKVYFFRSEDTGFSTCTYVYDPVANSWSTTAEPMPSFGGGYSVAVVDDIFYVVGEEQRYYNSGSYNSVYLNLQYVPMGYTGVVPAPETSNAPEQPNPSKSPNLTGTSFLTYLIVPISALTVGIVVIISVFFYLRARKSTKSVEYG